MIKLLFILFLFQMHSDSFETYSDDKPNFANWTVVDNDDQLCQRNGQYIVCPQIVQQPNSGAGRAYAITNGYVYDAPGLDECLYTWEKHTMLVPALIDKIWKWWADICNLQIYELIMFTQREDVPTYYFNMTIEYLEGKSLYNGYMYTWYEKDGC